MISTFAKNKTTKEIIEAAHCQIKALHLNILSTNSQKYRHFVLKEAENYLLESREVEKLAEHLKIEWISPPSSIPKSWLPSISKEFMSIQYTNPNNDEDYVVLVSSRSIFGIKGIIRHTPKGFLDTSWFTDFVPQFDEIAASYMNLLKNHPESSEKDKRLLISKLVNDPLNSHYSSTGMKQEELGAIHAFFKQYVPGIEGLCKKCFRLSLPKAGFGERWVTGKKINECEIRLSASKPDGYATQQILYVTQTYKDIKKADLLVSYEGIIREPPFVKWGHQGPTQATLKKNVALESVHIPWEIYNYHTTIHQLAEKVDFKLSLCECQIAKI